MKGTSIPQLYVVRADGQQLYGGAGSLPGDALPQMLLAALSRAGRSFNPEQARFLAKTVDAADEAFDDQQYLTAGVLLAELKTFGSPGDLKSHAEPARRAEVLFSELRSEIDQAVVKARSAITEGEAKNSFSHVLAICEAEAVLRLFPSWKADAASLKRDLPGAEAYEAQFEQAEALVKARLAAASPVSRIRNRAESLYTAVIRKYQGSPVSTFAREELERLNPEAQVLRMTSGVSSGVSKLVDKTDGLPGFRLWRASVGNFTTRAKYVQHNDGRVQLLKETGELIVVEINKLSDEDQKYLSTLENTD